MPTCAFVVGRQVKGADFYGRHTELAFLSRRIAAGQNVLITGESRIGKSSLLGESAQNPKLLELDHLVWLDHFGHPGISSDEIATWILEKLNKQLGYEISKKGGVALLLTTLERCTMEGKRVGLFINDLDDFFRGVESADWRIEGFFRALMETGHVVGAAVSQMPTISPVDKMRDPPLFNVFVDLPLGPFTTQEGDYFLQTASDRSGDGLTENERSFGIHLLGLVPHHLQHWGAALYHQPGFVGSSGGSRLDLMSLAIDHAFEELSRTWTIRLERLDESYINALHNAANGASLDPEDANVRFLQRRGLLADLTQPFAAMGELFRSFLNSKSQYQTDSTGGKTIWAKGAAWTMSIADHAARASISAAVKSFLS